MDPSHTPSSVTPDNASIEQLLTLVANYTPNPFDPEDERYELVELARQLAEHVDLADRVIAEVRELRAELGPVFRLIAQAQQIPRFAKALSRTDI